MSEPRVGIVVFAAGHLQWRVAARRLVRQANASARFTDVGLVTDKSLAMAHSEFTSSHASILRSGVRGFGYWIWKPYVIASAMAAWRSRIDIILYLDAGCEINVAKGSDDRWRDYIDMSLGQRLPFSMHLPRHRESAWSKADTMDALGLNDAQRSSGQIEATMIMLRVCEENAGFMNEWLRMCTADGYHLVDDSPSVAPNAPDFMDHRHDQSIFSGLMKKSGAVTIPNETYWAPDWAVRGAEYPIWAPRNRTGKSVADRRITRRVTTFTERASLRAYVGVKAWMRGNGR